MSSILSHSSPTGPSGLLALAICWQSLPLQCCASATGHYIGTFDVTTAPSPRVRRVFPSHEALAIPGKPAHRRSANSTR